MSPISKSALSATSVPPVNSSIVFSNSSTISLSFFAASLYFSVPPFAFSNNPLSFNAIFYVTPASI